MQYPKHTEPLDQESLVPMFIGLTIYAIVTLAGIGTVLYGIYRLLAWLF